MKRKTLLILLMAFVMAAAMATVASAGRPTCEPGSTYPWCDEEPPVITPTIPEDEDTIWTCQNRNDIGGAIWPIGTYKDEIGVYTYTGDGPALCIDILEIHHNVEFWDVEWSGTTVKGTETVKGLEFVFEEEVHANVFYRTVVTSVTSGDEPWSAELVFGDPTPDNMVFVAMPHSGDKWETFSITVTPSGGGHEG